MSDNDGMRKVWISDREYMLPDEDESLSGRVWRDEAGDWHWSASTDPPSSGTALGIHAVMRDLLRVLGKWENELDFAEATLAEAGW